MWKKKKSLGFFFFNEIPGKRSHWYIKWCEDFPGNLWSREKDEDILPWDSWKQARERTGNVLSRSPPPACHGARLPWFLCIKENTNTHTPQKEEMQSVHPAGISEINLSIGAGLNLQYEEIIFEFYGSICMILPPPPIKLPTWTTTSNYCFSEANSKTPYFITERIFLVCVSASIMSYLKEENEIKILSEIFIDLIKPDSLS